MPNFMDRLTKNSAELASRRRFFGTLGKVSSGLAALIVGTTVTSGQAFASNCPDCTTDQWSYCNNSQAFCCDDAYPYCGMIACPTNTYVDSYTWACCYNHRAMICYDCISSCTGEVVCTYAAQEGSNASSSLDAHPAYIPC